MKNKLIIIGLAILMYGCPASQDLENGTFKNGYSLHKFSTVNYDVVLNDVVIAHVTSIEWE